MKAGGAGLDQEIDLDIKNGITVFSVCGMDDTMCPLVGEMV